jgi:hypothetical protein
MTVGLSSADIATRNLERTTQAHVPLLVLTDREEDVEFINRTLRAAGHAVRCHWINHVERVTDALAEYSIELLCMFSTG